MAALIRFAISLLMLEWSLSLWMLSKPKHNIAHILLRDLIFLCEPQDLREAVND